MTTDEGPDFDEPDASEARTESFVVRVWLEEEAGEHAKPSWRGHITHVVSRERRYLRSLEDIALFIIPYLEHLGVRLHWGWRTRRWLRQR